MVAPSFRHSVEVDPDRFRFEPFKETERVRGFDSGSPSLDAFLNTEEVEDYQKEGYGTTWLVFYDGKLVAYFTICMDGLRVDYVAEKKVSGSHVKTAKERLETIPAIKIGRLAVQRRWQNRGVGRMLLRHIAGMAKELSSKSAVRLLVLQAKPESVDFYLRCGFRLTREVGRERGRRSRTMYLDLEPMKDVM